MQNLLILLLVVCPFLGFSQRTYNDDAPGLLDKRKKSTVETGVKPQKDDGYVFVASDLSVKEVAAKLIAENYLIDKMDTVMGTISTQSKIIPGRNGEYFLSIVKVDGLYKISSLMRWNFTASLAGISSAKGAYEVGRFTKSTGRGERRAFDAAQDAALWIGEIKRYSK